MIVFLLSAFGSLLLIIFNSSLFLIPILVSISKMGVSSGLNLSYITNVSLMPTILAGTSMGILNVSARGLTALAS